MAQDIVERYVSKLNIWSCEEFIADAEFMFFNDGEESTSSFTKRTPSLNESFLRIGTHTKYDDYYYVEGGWFPSGSVTEIVDDNTFISSGYTFIRKYNVNYFSKFSDGTNTYIVKDAEARTAIANKQDTLVSGTNIKTINNTSILGSGNISITQPSIATTSTAGLVKPDGTTITIDSNGTISAAGGSAYAMVIVDYTEEE